MDSIKLNASKREISGKKVKQLRAKGLVPAVIYGHGVDSRNISIEYRQMEKALNEAGESTLIDLTVDGGESVKTLISEVQYEPLIGSLVHIDFRQVKMDEKITTEIPINFIGEAPAVKLLGGTLVRNVETLTVTCLPGDLISEFEVSLDNLVNIDDNITVADIKVPSGMEIDDEPDQIIAIVTGVVSEEEMAKMDAASGSDVTEVKVVGDDKAAEPSDDKKE